MESLAHIPPPAERRIAVRVKPAAEKAIRRGHPWLFDDSIRRQSYQGRAGDLAVIFDGRDRFLAVGLYDPESPIRIRVLHHGRPATIDAGWFRERMAAAFDLRRNLFDSSTTGYRLLHGENDGLPGLVIDRYGDAG
ncbi:MAG: 23S rRNA (cytosine(2499)-C(5))-methyltransferase, partial [Chloroflexota bacterium]